MTANGKGPKAFELASIPQAHGRDHKQSRSRRPGLLHGLTVLSCAVVPIIVVCGAAFGQAGPAFTGLAATASNAETVYLNPAGMTRLDGMQFSVAPSIAYYDNEFRILPGSTEGAGTSIEDSGFGGIPAAALSYQINVRRLGGLRAGISGVSGSIELLCPGPEAVPVAGSLIRHRCYQAIWNLA